MNVYPLIADLNPFDWLIVLFGPYHLADVIIYAIILKLIAAGFFFYLFLKTLRLSFNASTISSISYAFCGFSMINSHWYHYLNYLIFAALMLYLYELWFQQGKWIGLVLSIAFVHLKGILQLYQLSFFFAIYGLFRILFENRFSIRSIFNVFSRFYMLFALGIACGAFYILPELYQGISSARGGDSIHKVSLMQWVGDLFKFADAVHIKTFIYRYISNDILGSYERFKGVSNYLESPAAYVGLMPLIVLPLLYFQVDGRQRAAFFVISMACLAYFFFPYVKVIGNAFASGTYKHTIMYNTIMILLLSSYSIDRIFQKDIKHKDVLYVSIAFFLGILIFSALTQEITIDKTIIRYAIGFFFLYGALISLICQAPLKQYSRTILLMAVIFELSLFGNITISRSSGAITKGFIDRGELYFDRNTISALDHIKKSDKNFYRIEKEYRSVYLNDAVVQGYYGTTAYYGFSPMPLVDFYQTMGLSRYSPRIASYRYGLEKRSKLQNLLNVKYHLTRDENDFPKGFSYQKSFGNVHVFRNPNVKPFGYVYYTYMRRNNFASLSLEEKDTVISDHFISDKDYPNLTKIPYPIFKNEKTELSDGERFQLIGFDEDRIAGRVELKEDGMVFFAIPYNKGWSAMVNGKHVDPELINIAFLGLPLKSGKYTIELKFSPPYLFTGVVTSLIGILFTAILYLRYPTIFPLNSTIRIKP